MKVFINQQKADLRSTKNLYKKVCMYDGHIIKILGNVYIDLSLESCSDFRTCRLFVYIRTVGNVMGSMDKCPGYFTVSNFALIGT